MSIETRFAPAADGPVPFRVDGSGDAEVLVVSDWGAPYGELGHAAYDAFAAGMAERGARVVTILDGTVGPRSAPPETARRIAAVQAVSEAAEMTNATLLGVADGAPVAAALAATGNDRVRRLVLFDDFSTDRRDGWGMSTTGGPTPEPNVPAETQDVAVQLQSANEALGWVRSLFKSVRDEVAEDPDMRDVQVPERAVRALKPWLGVDGTWSGGIGDLLEHISTLEGATEGASGSALAAINLPALVLDGGAEPDGAVADDTPLSLEIASQIPGSRHRRLATPSRWPWAVPELIPVLLEAPAVATPDRVTLGTAQHVDRILATVLFTDIVGSTERLTQMGDAAWRDLLDRHNQVVRKQLAGAGGREIDNSGDGFLAAFDIPARAVRCAMAIRDEIRGLGLAVRAGLHTGECEQVGENLVGIAVHIGARVAAQAGAHQILVSATVRDLIAGSGIQSLEHGVATLKGVPGEWLLYEIDA